MKASASFLKKEAKNFSPFKCATQMAKVFWFFFLKKEHLSSFDQGPNEIA
jgi:hypothetical protein